MNIKTILSAGPAINQYLIAQKPESFEVFIKISGSSGSSLSIKDYSAWKVKPGSELRSPLNPEQPEIGISALENRYKQRFVKDPTVIIEGNTAYIKLNKIESALMMDQTRLRLESLYARDKPETLKTLINLRTKSIIVEKLLSENNMPTKETLAIVQDLLKESERLTAYPDKVKADSVNLSILKKAQTYFDKIFPEHNLINQDIPIYEKQEIKAPFIPAPENQEEIIKSPLVKRKAC